MDYLVLEKEIYFSFFKTISVFLFLRKYFIDTKNRLIFHLISSQYTYKNCQYTYKNWLKWQIQLNDILFPKTGKIKEPDPRKIITIYDPKGNSGKSSFFKYLFFKYPEDIARISYGSAQQLRSSLVNISPHKIYIVDLARAKGRNDSEVDLLAVLEDLKNGLVFNAMYGSGSNLLMEPPHIIVSANYVPKMNLFR